MLTDFKNSFTARLNGKRVIWSDH